MKNENSSVELMNKIEKSLDTRDLIATLSQDLKPVKRLASPFQRMMLWIAISLPISLLLGALIERQGLALAFERLTTARSLVELAAILLTALTAGYAAFSTTQPGRSSKVWMLPLLPFFAWLLLMGENCLALFEQLGADQFSFAPHWICYPTVVATGAMPAAFIVWMLMRGMLVYPTLTVGLATLAASSLGAVGLRLFHPPDATIMLLVWQLIATATMFVVLSLASRIFYGR